MGQIVGGAARPKRCNLDKLSQLGTPAADEYILVSSDNSMNAAGQGNFDCYIVGDGTTAAMALELKRIKKEMYVYSDKELYTTYTGKAIGTNGIWVDDANFDVKAYKIEHETELHIKATKDGSYAVFQFQSKQGAINSAYQANTYIKGGIHTSAEDTIAPVPTDATYLMVCQSTTNNSNAIQTVYEPIIEKELNSSNNIPTSSSVKNYIDAINTNLSNSIETIDDSIYKGIHVIDIPSLTLLREKINDINASPISLFYLGIGDWAYNNLSEQNARQTLSGIKLTRGQCFVCGLEVAEGYSAVMQVTKTNVHNTVSSSNEAFVLSSGWKEGKSTFKYSFPNTLNTDILYIQIAFKQNSNELITGQNVLDNILLSLYAFTENIERMNESDYDTNITALNPPSEYLPKLNDLRRAPYNTPITGKESLVIAHFSDIHGSEENTRRIVEWCRNENFTQYIDDIILSGDIVYNEFSDGSSFLDNVDGGDNILLAIGNHDTRVGSDWYGTSVLDKYNEFFANRIANWNVISGGNVTWYYKDYTSYGVRLVVVDCMDSSSEQSTWLSNTLSNAISQSLAVIIVTHSSPSNPTFIDCSFNSPQCKGKYSSYIGPDITDKVDAFISNGGEFVCYLAGHLHWDKIGVLSNNNDQLCIQIDAARTQDGYMDKCRVVGERSQDLFNIVSVNTSDKTIRLIRVGATHDRFGRNAIEMCYRYKDYTDANGIIYQKGIVSDN